MTKFFYANSFSLHWGEAFDKNDFASFYYA